MSTDQPAVQGSETPDRRIVNFDVRALSSADPRLPRITHVTFSIQYPARVSTFTGADIFSPFDSGRFEFAAIRNEALRSEDPLAHVQASPVSLGCAYHEVDTQLDREVTKLTILLPANLGAIGGVRRNPGMIGHVRLSPKPPCVARKEQLRKDDKLCAIGSCFPGKRNGFRGGSTEVK